MHHVSGLLSTWQFLMKCSHTCTAFEERQRHRAVDIEEAEDEDNMRIPDLDIPEQNEEPPEVAGPPSPEPQPCFTCRITLPGVDTAQYIALPCGHAWLCAECVIVLEDQNPRRCPMCREDIANFQRIFYGY